MTIIKAFCIALSTYSRIPMPKFEWKGREIKLAVIFFPIIGVIVGLAEYLLYMLFKIVDLPVFPMTVMCCGIPVLITRGIHLNGYMHTLDALSFKGSHEKKLEIMRDLHVGGYSVIRMFLFVGGFASAVYLLLYYSFDHSLISYMQSDFLIGGSAIPPTVAPYTIEEIVYVWAMSFVLSRLMSAISLVTFPFTDKSGQMYAFSGRDESGKINKTAFICLVVEEIIVLAAMLFINPVAGGVLIATSLLAFIFYWISCKKGFGGFTGDLTGWFLCLSEFWMTIAAAVLAIIM